jgi:hypothetical protein
MSKVTVRTGADFASKHIRTNAVTAKIQAALVKIKSVGPEHWEYETDLSKPPYSISSRDLADYRDQFDPFWLYTEVQEGEKPRRVWFADPKVAAKYRTVPNHPKEG